MADGDMCCLRMGKRACGLRSRIREGWACVPRGSPRNSFTKASCMCIRTCIHKDLPSTSQKCIRRSLREESFTTAPCTCIHKDLPGMHPRRSPRRSIHNGFLHMLHASTKTVERAIGKAKRWSDVSCPQQRSLQATQVCFPATADSAQFYLLCCQPGSVPTSLSARTSQLSLWCPCRLSAWPGQTIHMANRTC